MYPMDTPTPIQNTMLPKGCCRATYILHTYVVGKQKSLNKFTGKHMFELLEMFYHVKCLTRSKMLKLFQK